MYRNFFSYALRSPHRLCIYFSSSYYDQCEKRLSYALYACKWCFYDFYFSLSPYWTWFILPIIYFRSPLFVMIWPDHFSSDDGNSFYRLRFTVRSNEFLRGYCYNKPCYRGTCSWGKYCLLIMRRFFRKQCNFGSFF